nr:MAG TPA: hypothetical protein [Caudoviricetes sp.]
MPVAFDKTIRFMERVTLACDSFLLQRRHVL